MKTKQPTKFVLKQLLQFVSCDIVGCQSHRRRRTARTSSGLSFWALESPGNLVFFSLTSYTYQHCYQHRNKLPFLFVYCILVEDYSVVYYVFMLWKQSSK